MKRFISFMIYGIIALGVLGLLSRLFNDPIGFFRNILIIAIVAGIIYMIYTGLTKENQLRKSSKHSERLPANRKKG
ncbi:hypothetical protein KEH51_28940 [[Brevibacterium] frigoritolerans]|uniref:Uncharacterized protein n=1 Tax=Peribacillus frigoritolerans TaxID=450367 RepID=A0A941FTD1_9BACI|nr:hypothetical protein [Peribacillus frigoritolerans]